MKKYSTYIKALTLAAVFMISNISCKKFLTEDPKNVIAITNYYKTANDAVSAVNSIYGWLNSISSGTYAVPFHTTFCSEVPECLKMSTNISP